MDIIGKWKIKEFRIPTSDGILVFTPDTLPFTSQVFDMYDSAKERVSTTNNRNLKNLL